MARLDDNRLQEKVEVLDGSRAGSREQAAVRIVDLQSLMTETTLQAKELTAAPTVADFNALLKDLKAINEKLTSVARVLQTRLMR